eukprot:441400_1
MSLEIEITKDSKTPLIKQKSAFLSMKLWNASIISGFVSMKKTLGTNFGTALQILILLATVFMFSQVSRYLLGVTVSNMQKDQQWGRGDGTGPEYDFLAGPAFAITSIIATLPIGFIADKGIISRKHFLCVACILWSVSTIFTGASKTYWHVFICRMLIAVSTSAAKPLSAAIISDWFPSSLSASAMAVFNFAIYTGFSVAYGIGNWLQNDFSWRLAWYIFGFISLFFGFTMFFLPEYKSSTTEIEMNDTNCDEGSIDNEIQQIVTIKEVIAYFSKTPSLIILLIASLYRNSGGNVWGYSANNFLENEKGQTPNEIAQYLGWIPGIFGSIGCLFGGALSDRLATKYGSGANETQFIESTVTVRIWVLVIASLISGPFAAGVLIFDPPYGYYSLIIMYLFSEMWISITVTIVAELSPQHMKSTLLSIYYFCIAFGGFSPQLITPIEDMTNSYFWAIFILWPFVYASVSILFFVVIFTYKRDLRKRRVFQT